MKRSLLALGLLISGSAYAADNQIYITQTTSGVTNTQIDIEQLGSGNVVAGDTSNTTTVDNAMILNSSNMVFNLDQIGDTNFFRADINSNTSDFNFSWTGDSNTLVGQWNPAGTYDINTTDWDNIIQGGNNAQVVNYGVGADASDGTVNWNINGSDNSITFTAATAITHSGLNSWNSMGSLAAADSSNMNLDWDISGGNNTINAVINSKYVTQDWDITGSYNEIDYVGINNSGASSGNGHVSNISVTGSYWDIGVYQSSTGSNDYLNFSTTGSGTSGTNATLCVIQSGSGSVTC
tara:strand:+ start:4283 stop:5164 length:882 start_codon:yes stop_codon:yes gene_type:complete